jgi:hypothetical protein
MNTKSAIGLMPHLQCSPQDSWNAPRRSCRSRAGQRTTFSALRTCSCATLFVAVPPAGSVFDHLLAKSFEGKRDNKTLHLLQAQPSRKLPSRRC